MKFQKLLPAAFAGLASAQSLSDALASQNASLSLLNNILASQTALLQTLNNTQNITVLAPNNDALNAYLNSGTGSQSLSNTGLLTALLDYHVLQGVYYSSNITDMTVPAFISTSLDNATYSNVTGGQRVEAMETNGNITFVSGMLQNSSVTISNVNFTGGTIHIVDAVLTMPANDTATALAANLTALVGAISQSNMASNISSTRDVTIFAPSNDAFDAIGNLANNLSASQLDNILNYHVVPGMVAYSPSLSNGTVRAANGENIQVQVDADGNLFVNSAKVIQPDVLVSNGVVHIIDNVLNPSNTTATPNPTASTQVPAFSGAASTTDVPFTSGVPAATTTIATAGGAGTSSSSAAAVPMMTGAIGAAALLGGAVILVNY